MNYTVKKGDTLSQIASRFKTSVSQIQKANPSITNVNKIVVGQVITIPTSSTKNYDAIGKQFCECLKDIKSLSSYQKLIKML